MAGGAKGGELDNLNQVRFVSRGRRLAHLFSALVSLKRPICFAIPRFATKRPHRP